jgi:hypothetical protein
VTEESRRKWTARVTAWRASGQSAPEFAAGKGFEPSTLRYWASKLGRTARRRSPIRFARVERVASSSAVTIAIGAARVEVPVGADESTLRAVVRILIESSR